MTIYKTIKDTGVFEYKEKGSRFIASAFNITDEQSALIKLNDLRKLHFKANHVCFAYKTGFEKFTERASDDGEPSYTAGTPILQQINKYELTQVLVAVVRYFGGVKLGKGGLIRAYSTAAENALLASDFIDIEEHISYQFSVNFNFYNEIMDELKKLNAVISNSSFEKECNFEISITKSKLIQLEILLNKTKRM